MRVVGSGEHRLAGLLQALASGRFGIRDLRDARRGGIAKLFGSFFHGAQKVLARVGHGVVGFRRQLFQQLLHALGARFQRLGHGLAGFTEFFQTRAHQGGELVQGAPAIGVQRGAVFLFQRRRSGPEILGGLFQPGRGGHLLLSQESREVRFQFLT